MKHKKLTQTERTLLSQWRKEGVAKKEIARRLKRDIRTIQRKLIRNKTRVKLSWNDWEYIYEPIHAQYVATQRKQNAFFAKHPLNNKKIYAYCLKNWKRDGAPSR